MEDKLATEGLAIVIIAIGKFGFYSFGLLLLALINNKLKRLLSRKL